MADQDSPMPFSAPVNKNVAGLVLLFLKVMPSMIMGMLGVANTGVDNVGHSCRRGMPAPKFAHEPAGSSASTDDWKMVSPGPAPLKVTPSLFNTRALGPKSTVPGAISITRSAAGLTFVRLLMAVCIAVKSAATCTVTSWQCTWMVLLARQTSKQAHRRCCAGPMLKQALLLLLVGLSAAGAFGCLAGLRGQRVRTAVGLRAAQTGH